MKNAIGVLKRLFPTTGEAILAGLLGVSGSLCIYLATMQRHFFSKRYVLYALLIAGTITLLAGWLNGKLLKGRVRSLPKGLRISALVFSLLMGVIVLANTKIQPLYYLLPDTKLEMRIPIGDVPHGQENVVLAWIHTGQDYVHYTDLEIEGGWERVGKNIVFAPNQEVRISWQGKAGSEPVIAFRLTTYDQPVYAAWNGAWHDYNLYSAVIDPYDPNLLIQEKLRVPLVCQLPFMFSFTIGASYLIFTALILLGTWHPAKRTQGSKKYGWLKYMLPMLICWGFTLLVFWPGFMTNDSMAQWVQGVDNHFQDWHSAFHALILALLMRIWYSPAFVAILQIVVLSGLVAWGLKILEDNGVPVLVTWMICILFALSPTNGILMSTIWKDIPYAISVLWLSMLLLSIFLSEGKWIEKKYRWVVLGIAGFSAAIFRQNGIAVSFICLLSLLLFYRPLSKAYLKSFLLFCLLYAGVKGPLYRLAKVDQNGSGQSNLILLHHIAAHLDAGSVFTSAERDYLDSFLPLSEWDYSCCYMGPIYFADGFDQTRFLNSTDQNLELAFNLFKRDPLVDFRHLFCAGEVIWKYGNTQCSIKSTNGFYSIENDDIVWIIPNDVGLETNSQLPALVKPYVEYLRKFGFFDSRLVFYLDPALYLYLAAFFAMVAALRFRNWRAWLVALPIISQSAILFVINFVPAFRYLYSNLLVGTFFIGLLFISSKNTN